MRKRDAIKQLATKNPKVDLAQLLESLRMTRKIRRIGITGPGYRLMPSGTGKRVHIVEDAEDPRTIKLQHRS